ncbi:MAG: flippase activity-associated protein Agl23 [Acidimicrobiales bacterium]
MSDDRSLTDPAALDVAEPEPIPGQLNLLDDDLARSAAPKWFNLRNVAIGLVVLAFVSRLAALGARAFHHDESLDAWFSWRFLEGTFDGYDPVYHGPLRFYITGAFFWLFGESETTARLLAALAGAAVVGLIWCWRRELGSVGTVAAMALAIMSPSLLYFSRVGREDSFFLALTFASVIVFVSFLTRPKPWHPTAIFCFLVAALAVKESVFITVFIFGAFGMVLLTQELLLAPGRGAHGDSATDERDPNLVRRITLLGGLGLMIVAFGFGEPIFVSLGTYGLVLGAALVYGAVSAVGRGVDVKEVPVLRSIVAVPFYWWLVAVWSAILLFVVVFTQFLTNFDGAGTDSAPYGSIENGLRAGFEYWRGEQDTVRGDSRWYYYLAVIPAYEWFILALSAIGIGRVIRRPTLVGQTLVWWGVGSFAAHSWAGERMPWLIIHPLLPFVLLAGLGVQVLWDHRRGSWVSGARRPVAVVVGVVVGFGLLWTLNASIQASYTDRGGQPQELFVQAGQATQEVPEWVDRLYLLDRLVMAEEGRHLTVSIDSDVYWPYGWYLRDFPTGTFAVIEADSDAPDTDVIFVPHWEQGPIGAQLVDTHTTLPYEHRWWWVPDFLVGPQSWGRWLWDRQPWDGTVENPSDCPGSLVGQVFVRNAVFQLEQQYFASNPPVPAPKPDYEGPCQRPDTLAMGG